jgi:hypothetical protein
MHPSPSGEIAAPFRKKVQPHISDLRILALFRILIHPLCAPDNKRGSSIPQTAKKTVAEVTATGSWFQIGVSQFFAQAAGSILFSRRYYLRQCYFIEVEVDPETGQISALAFPETFRWSRPIDAPFGLVDPRSMEIHDRVERWTLDEAPLPGRLVCQISRWLYGEDRFFNER